MYSNKDLVKIYLLDIVQKKKYDLLPDIIHECYTPIENAPSELIGIDALHSRIKKWRSVFEEKIKIEMLIEEGDIVIAKLNVKTIQLKPWLDLKPSNNIAENKSIAIFKIKDGKIYFIEVIEDMFSFLFQLGHTKITDSFLKWKMFDILKDKDTFRIGDEDSFCAWCLEEMKSVRFIIRQNKIINGVCIPCASKYFKYDLIEPFM